MNKSIVFPALFVTSLLIGCGTENPLSETASEPLATDSQPSSDPPQSPQEPDSATDELPSDDDLVQRDVRKMVNAVYQSDVDIALSYTHPKIIDLMGGTGQARSALETAFSKFQTLNMKLESLAFPEAPTFLKTDVNRFVIVPTKSIILANGQRLESLNYQFGIQEHGTNTWKYIEGSRINNQNVRSLFPDFPSDYDFPEFYRKKL